MEKKVFEVSIFGVFIVNMLFFGPAAISTSFWYLSGFLLFAPFWFWQRRLERKGKLRVAGEAKGKLVRMKRLMGEAMFPLLGLFLVILILIKLLA